MAHHKDAIKRIKQNERRRLHHRHYRTRMRNQTKVLRDAIDSGDVESAQAQLKTAMSVIQRTASKGVIHRNQAARRISRLNAAVKKLVASQAA
ncbi:MAG: 30S ribosomal protein S20 [Proteobacteria bacterium]|nr:30S ribosomal protein S20 [Pseudomonadota bacterium]